MVTTSYNEDGHGSVLVYEGDTNSNGKLDDNEVKVSELKGNGDFRSKECIELLKEADIVVTNPPFSLFREYIATLVQYNKKFLVIGNQNAITYKEIFPLIKENKLWTGNNMVKTFRVPQVTNKNCEVLPMVISLLNSAVFVGLPTLILRNATKKLSFIKNITRKNFQNMTTMMQ